MRASLPRLQTSQQREALQTAVPKNPVERESVPLGSQPYLQPQLQSTSAEVYQNYLSPSASNRPLFSPQSPQTPSLRGIHAAVDGDLQFSPSLSPHQAHAQSRTPGVNYHPHNYQGGFNPLSATGNGSFNYPSNYDSPESVQHVSPVEGQSAARYATAESQVPQSLLPYEPVKLIGSGGFAKVYLWKKKDTGQLVAAKVVDLGPNTPDVVKHKKALEVEVRILQKLENQFIVTYQGTVVFDNKLAMLIDYVPGGTVYQKVSDGTPLDEKKTRMLTWQILKGVEYLHSKHVTHRDIKGRNILLDNKNMIKITDFGISKTMEDLVTTAGTSKVTIASVYWTSPELLDNDKPTEITDIWSVGCTVVEMLFCKPPLQLDGLLLVQAINKINKFEVFPPEECSQVAKEFLHLCFKKKDERPSASQLLANTDFPKTSCH